MKYVLFWVIFRTFVCMIDISLLLHL